MRYAIHDPKKGIVEKTASNTQAGAWKRFIESPWFNKLLFNEAVKECAKNGFKAKVIIE